MHRATGKASYLADARAAARRELTALATVDYPYWWQLPERVDWLDALLALHEH